MHRRRLRACHAPSAPVGLGRGACGCGPGLAHRASLRRLARAPFNLLGIVAWLPVIVLAGCPSRRWAGGADPAALSQDQGHPAQGFRDRAGGAQCRHHRLRCRPVLRPARLGEAARRPAHHALRGGEGLPRRADQRALPHGHDWAIRHNDREIPEEVWSFVKKHGSSACSSPRSTAAWASTSAVADPRPIGSRSPDTVTIVMVPNSLGPGELIEKYGTPEQKHHYLPRLAKGLEVPCFALTGPTSAPTPPPCATSAM